MVLWRVILWSLVIGPWSFAAAPVATNAANLATPTVGMEGQLAVALPGALLAVKPLDRASPLVLRVADTRPHGSLIHYDLRYVGLVPGEYDLRTNLVRQDGSSTDDLPPLLVRVTGLLPRNHSGRLIEPIVQPWSIFGNYRQVMWTVIGLWLTAGLLLWGWVRRRKPVTVDAAPPPAPTLADRLRPLVEQAAAGTLPRDGQAELERLLVNHWRQRLGVEAEGFAEAVTHLKAHPEAGALLRELENWLHRPPGSVRVDVPTVLAPYRDLPAEEPASQQRRI